MDKQYTWKGKNGVNFEYVPAVIFMDGSKHWHMAGRPCQNMAEVNFWRPKRRDKIKITA